MFKVAEMAAKKGGKLKKVEEKKVQVGKLGGGKKKKKKSTQIKGILTSIQFDQFGFPLYMFTDKGIYHVEFRELEKTDDEE